MKMREMDFLGLHFAALSRAEAVAALRQAKASGAWQYVVTPNAAHLARLRHDDAALHRAYAGAAFCFLDSRVIALAARAAGLRPPPVVPGSDLVASLFREAIDAGTPICIIGGEADAVAELKRRYGLLRVAHLNPSRGFWRDAAEVSRVEDFVRDAQADYTFLVVGSPQQELLAQGIADGGGARGVGVCAGAAIEFLTGQQRRAPLLLQRMALEWAYRLVLEPRRLAHRYFVESPMGVMLVVRHASVGWRRRWKKHTMPAF